MENLQTVYSDFDLSFNKNIYKDVAKKLNANAITQAVKNIILTRKGEKLFNQEFGTQIGSSLFQNIDNFIANFYETDLEMALKRYDPRITKINVNVEDSGSNALYITITYYTKFSIEPIVVEILLEKVR